MKAIATQREDQAKVLSCVFLSVAQESEASTGKKTKKCIEF
jgi:hypothetical protein